MRPSLPFDQSDRHAAAAVRAVVVSADDLLGHRIREALARCAIVVAGSGGDVSALLDHTADAAVVVLAGLPTAAALRDAIRAAGTRFGTAPCVVVASLSSNGVRKVLDAGAAGVVLESDVETALVETIRAVLVNQLVVPRRFIGDATRAPLTHREKEALALVARGFTNRQIANRLFLSESTVKTHLASVFGKLGVASRSEATALVLDPEVKLGLDVVDVSS